MEDSLSIVVGALAMGAAAVPKEVTSDATRDAYQALRAVIVRKLGGEGAVQGIEHDPDSQESQTDLIEALAAKNLTSDHELGALARNVIRSATADASNNNMDASIRIGRIRGSVGAIVEQLCAAGRITLGEVTAERGEVRVKDLSAGTDIVARLPRPANTGRGKEKPTSEDDPGPTTSVFSDFSAGRDIVVNLGSTATASKFSGKIQAFFEEYLVTETGTERVPFGGRGNELKFLDRWLSDLKAPARLVLVGPAGRGKSALLVNWTLRLTASLTAATSADFWNVVFVPISIRFNTNRPAIFYEVIAARLAEILEVNLRPPQADPVAYYEDQCRMLARRAMELGRRILIIIDGADEALGSSFEAKWFPRQSEGALRILVSARLQIGDVDARGWVRRLDWETGVRCHTLELPSLDAAGVKNLLATSGAPLDYLATRPEIVDKLHRLSEGEPLILRLYVEDLWLRGQGSQELTVDDLDRIRPGLSGYFEDWLRRQQDVWREDRKDGVPIDSAVLGVQLALLACAHGPLSAKDIGELLRQCGCRNDGLRIEDGLYPLRRFVIGAGRRLGVDFHGYVLSHPRFGQFLRENYLDELQVAEARTALVRWGGDSVRRTNEGTLPPDQVPRYVLNYHSQHLLDADVSSDGFMAMVEPGWLRACEAHEGGYRGFSEAVAAAMNALLREKPRTPNWRSALVRCALFQTSVASLVSQMPEEVLLPSVQAGLMSPLQVLHWLDFHPQEVRARVLVQLSAFFDDTNVTAALEACRSLTYEVLRARSLSAVIPRMSQGERHAIAIEALSILGQLHDRWDRPLAQPANGKLIGETLTSIATYLDAEELVQAVAVARALSYDENRVLTFLAMALAVPADGRHALLRQALSALSGVQDYRRRYELMRQLMPHLTAEFLQPLIDAVCGGGSDEHADEPGMAEFIDELMSQLPLPYRILAFEAAIRLEGPGARYKVGARILRHVPKDQYTLALLTSLAFVKGNVDQARFLSNLAEFVTASVVEIFIRHAQISGGEQAAAAAIAQMAPHLSEEAADQALMLALRLDELSARMTALFALVPCVSDSLIGKLLDEALDLQHIDDRGKLLIAVIPRLTADEMDAAVEAVASLTDPCQRVDGLLAVGRQRAGAGRLIMIREALAITSDIGNRHECTESVIACVTTIAECEAAYRVPLLLECLQQSISLRHDQDFLQVFRAIAQQLAVVNSVATGDCQLHLQLGKIEAELHLSLRRLSSLPPSDGSYIALNALEQAARWIPASHLTELLRVAAKIENEAFWPLLHLVPYAMVLAAALARLPEQERAKHLLTILKRLEAPQDRSLSQAPVYAALAPHLPKGRIGRWLEVASTIEDESSRASALVDLAAQLPEADRIEWLAQALVALRASVLQRSSSVPAVLKRLIPLLPGGASLAGELLSIALELTISFANELLWDCIKRIPEHQRASVLASAIEKAGVGPAMAAVEAGGDEVSHALECAAHQVSGEDQRAMMLAAIARRSSPEKKKAGMELAAQAALAIRDDMHRARILAGLANDLPAREAAHALKEALRASQTIADDIVQFKALGALLDYLPGRPGSELASQAVSRLASIQDVCGRCALLHAVFRVMDRSQWLALVGNEVAYAAAAHSDWERSVAWSALAPLLPEEQLAEAWKSATHIDSAEDLLRAVGSLVEGVPEPLVDELLGNLHQYPSEIRGELAIILAPRVPIQRVPQLVAGLADLTDESMHARALLAMAPKMSGASRQDALRQAVELSRNVGDRVTFARSLIAVIEIEEDRRQNAALVRAALEAVLSIPSSQWQDRMAALKALVPHLTPHMIPLALQEAPAGAVVAVLRPKLSDVMVKDLLARMTGNYSKPMDLIAALGADLPAGLHVEAFKALQEWLEDALRIPAVAKLLPYVDDATKDDTLIALAECAARVDREVVLGVLPDYVSMISRSEGVEGAARMGRSLLEVGKFFP